MKMYTSHVELKYFDVLFLDIVRRGCSNRSVSGLSNLWCRPWEQNMGQENGEGYFYFEIILS